MVVASTGFSKSLVAAAAAAVVVMEVVVAAAAPAADDDDDAAAAVVVAAAAAAATLGYMAAAAALGNGFFHIFHIISHFFHMLCATGRDVITGSDVRHVTGSDAIFSPFFLIIVVVQMSPYRETREY